MTDTNASHDWTVAGRGCRPRRDARCRWPSAVRGLSDRAIAWLFIAPTILLLLAINIFPLIWTIYLSFTNYRANRPNAEIKSVGLRNYERILTDTDIWHRHAGDGAFRLLDDRCSQTLIGFALAYLIDRKFRGHAFWTTVILMPMMLSPAVVGNFWSFLYEPQIGLFNYVVSFFTGIPTAPSFQMLGDVALAPWSIIIVDIWMWTPYVMLICLAGLRSIPDYIYEAAEVDRASQLAAVLVDHAADGAALHHAGGAVPRHRELQDVRHGQPADRRRPRLDHRGRLDHAEARGLRELADRLFLGLRHHPLRRGVRPRQHLREGAEPGEAAMSAATQAHSVVAPTPLSKRIAAAIVIAYALITMIPLVWIVATSFKTPPDSIAYPPKIVFTPSLEGYCNLFTTRTRQTPEYIGSPAAGDDLVRRARRASATW